MLQLHSVLTTCSNNAGCLRADLAAPELGLGCVLWIARKCRNFSCLGGAQAYLVSLCIVGSS